MPFQGNFFGVNCKPYHKENYLLMFCPPYNTRVPYKFIHGKRIIYTHSINYVSQEKYKNDWENRCVLSLRLGADLVPLSLLIRHGFNVHGHPQQLHPWAPLSPPPPCSPSCGFSIFSFTSFWPFCTWVSMSIIGSLDSYVKTQSTTCIQFLFVFHSYYVHMWNSNSRIAPQIATDDRQEI